MKNIVYIKKLNVESLECECCSLKDLIRVNGVDLMVRRQHGLALFEDKEYELFLDITCGTPDSEGYEQSFLEREPILDELNEYYEFLTKGIISKQDFDILLDDKVSVFKSRTIDGDYYKIIGQVKDEYLVTKGIYFYIGKNREAHNGKFLVAYSEFPDLCETIEKA